MSKPIAVLISDVHYSLNTFQIADTAFRLAIDKAAALGVPLIDCGDLTNDKAALRAEYVNALIDTMTYAADKGVKVYCLVGNHSLTHEKASTHALRFLEPYCTVVDTPTSYGYFNFIPYQTSAAAFLEALFSFPVGSVVIGHQGTLGGDLGDYVKDGSAFDPLMASAYKLYLGHYHAHYILHSTVSVGNPYTKTFGEAKDAAKAFLVLYEDGAFSRVLTRLRKHVKLEMTTLELSSIEEEVLGIAPGDLVWLKVTGAALELAKIKKDEVGMLLFGHNNFKLDKIVTDSAPLESKADSYTPETIMDMVIDNTDDTAEAKAELKALWREVLS